MTAWRDLVLDQLVFYWEAHLWPRLRGLSDEEYLWEPATGAWSLREGSDGVVQIETLVPEPPVPPVTTIAWRLAHVGRDVLGKRARAVFEGSPTHAGREPTADGLDVVDMFDERHWPEPLPLTAAGGLALLEHGYTLWREGLEQLDDAALLRPLGPVGGPYAQDSLAALALHVNRETMAHGAEICLLRDLFRARVTYSDPVVRAAFAGQASEVERLLTGDGDAVARLAESSPSLLVDVAGLRRWEAVRALAAHGFPVTGTTETGATALHYAAADGRADVVNWLASAGADVRAVESGFGLTPEGWARFVGAGEVADVLAGLAG